MSYEPPPQIEEWSWIWKKWLYGLWDFVDHQFKLGTVQDILNSSSLADDQDLDVMLSANGTYDIEAYIIWSSASATPDVKFKFVEPDGTWEGIANEKSGTTIATTDFNEATANKTLAITSSEKAKLHIRILAKAGTAGGIFKLQWAQNTSNGTATTREACSWIKARKLN